MGDPQKTKDGNYLLQPSGSKYPPLTGSRVANTLNVVNVQGVCMYVCMHACLHDGMAWHGMPWHGMYVCVYLCIIA